MAITDCVGGAVADATRGARLIMTAPQADTAVLISNIPDLSDVPLDQDVAISQSELKRIVREVIGDQPATPVSSFNSSI